MIALLISLFVGIISVPVMIFLANKLNILDLPDGRIKCHKAPVPYLGGVAVYLAFFAPFVIFGFPPYMLFFIVGSTLLLVLGLIDDIYNISPAQKFLGQIVAVLFFLYGGFVLNTNFFSPTVDMILSGFFMLSVINAYNLVDVMDGLATSLTLISAVGLFVVAVSLGSNLIVFFESLIGALVAFFLYNRPSAKIYLGDAGSLFIGGSLAALSLGFSWGELLKISHPLFKSGFYWGTFLAFIVPVLIMGVPLLEVTSLILIRTYKGIPFYSGSPHHFASFLRAKNLSVWGILLFSWSAAILLLLLSVLFLFGKFSSAGLIIGFSIFLALWCWALI